MRKIAIVGSSPIAFDLTPFNDPSWEIWGMNQNFKSFPRFDRWFDLHAPGKMYWSKEYQEFLKNNQGKLWLQKGMIEIHFPNANEYPIKNAVKIFGKYFKSQVDYLITLAIIENADEIGLFGIELADGEERINQRRSCEHKLGYAQAKGIKITIPDESPILKSSYMYAFEEIPTYMKYLKLKRLELINRIHAEKDQNTKLILSGAFEINENLINSWL